MILFERPVLLYVLGAAVFALLAGISMVRTRRARREWQAFALRHGLEYEPPGSFREAVNRPEMLWPYGRVHGFPSSGIELDLRVPSLEGSSGIGKTRARSSGSGAIMRVSFPGVPEGLHVSARRGSRPKLVERIWAMGGIQAVETGDPAFDGKCSVLATDAGAACAYLTDTRRQALIQLATEESWALDPRGLSRSWPGACSDPAELDRVFGELLEAAHALLS